MKFSTTSPPFAGGRRRGTVYLVGAGPGDPGLLTRRAVRLLRRANVVVHDALVGEGTLDLIGPSAVRIDVGKRCGGRHTSQERINQILVEAAADHRTVVRLKGGDPFVFGRGGEEALALAEAGVRFEVVPGVTAAVGVSAYAGIPLTHRDFASSVTFVTGHEDKGRHDARVDWDAVAKLGGTLVIYMGVSGLDSIAERLVGGGRSADTPAAAVQWGTYGRQRTVEAPLSEIAAAAREAGIGAPALVIVGEVVALREHVAWFDRLPLRGRRLVVARSRPQPSRLAAALRRLGAEVVEYPRLEAEGITGERPGARAASSNELESEAPGTSAANRALLRSSASFAPTTAVALPPLRDYDWLAFTSPAGVDYFWRALEGQGLDTRALAGARVASLGLATTRSLRRRGIGPDVATRTYEPGRVPPVLEGVAPLDGARVLLPRETDSRSAVAASLRSAGAVVDELPLFRIVPHPPSGDADLDADAVLLPSSNSARLVARDLKFGPRTRVVAIGPRTAETALAVGLTVDAVADDHTIPGTVRALMELLGGAARPAWSTPASDEAPSVGV